MHFNTAFSANVNYMQGEGNDKERDMISNKMRNQIARFRVNNRAIRDAIITRIYLLCRKEQKHGPSWSLVTRKGNSHPPSCRKMLVLVPKANIIKEQIERRNESCIHRNRSRHQSWIVMIENDKKWLFILNKINFFINIY